jgi:hypothetical protein
MNPQNINSNSRTYPQNSRRMNSRMMYSRRNPQNSRDMYSRNLNSGTHP